MAIWFLIFPVAWVVIALVTGEEMWRLGVAPLLWLMVPWFVTRVMRFQTIILDAQSIRRVGFFKDGHMAWADITGIRHFEQRYGKRGMGMIAMVALQAEGRELIMCPVLSADPDGHIRWAFDRVEAGEVSQIRDRVEAQGRPLNRLSWYTPHLITALVLSLGVGYFLMGDQRRKYGERLLRGAENAPYERKLKSATALLQNEKYSHRLRCRAGTMLVYAEIREDHMEKAISTCETIRDLSCSHVPYDPSDCSPLKELLAAKTATSPEQVLTHLKAVVSDYPPAIVYSLALPALRKLGRTAEAEERAKACWKSYGDSDHAATKALVEVCRPTEPQATP